jgi:hypothetical protein
MPSREYVRNGHHVHIDIDTDSQGRWRWNYTIDGSGYTEMRDRPIRSEGAATLEAEQDANAKVNRMPEGDADLEAN